MRAQDDLRITPGWENVLRRAGIASAADVWSAESIRVWRAIRERDNAVIDARHDDGSPVRLHLKRDRLPGQRVGADREADGLRVLGGLGIASATLVARGRRGDDGTTFVITEDLAGYHPADALVRDRVVPFDRLIEPTARVAARLHAAGAFHRDLYLCHLFVDPVTLDCRPIDVARLVVNPFWARRWRVKDLAAMRHSLRELAIDTGLVERWFEAYAAAGGSSLTARLRRAIEAKAARIARHDRSLRRAEPGRHASLNP
jgi:hypothetical protein